MDNLERSRLSETSHFDARQGVRATWLWAKLHWHPGEHQNDQFRTTLSAQGCPFNLAPSQVEWTPWRGSLGQLVCSGRGPLVSKFVYRGRKFSFSNKLYPGTILLWLQIFVPGSEILIFQKTLPRYDFIMTSNLRTGVGNFRFPKNLTPVRFLFLTSNSI